MHPRTSLLAVKLLCMTRMMKSICSRQFIFVFGLLLLLIAPQMGCHEITITPPVDDPKPEAGSPVDQNHLNICTSNIQFLGGSKLRDNQALAQIFKSKKCDAVVVQELISPPDLRLLPSSPFYNMKEEPSFPDGALYVPNPRNTEFFTAMYEAGFDRFWLSEEDTGTSEKNHSNGTNTEWFVTFYRSARVKPKLEIPNGFLDADRTRNSNYDRVPYAFAFQSVDNSVDFVLISVHLHPGAGTSDRARRKIEIAAIFDWISEQKTLNSERDYIVLGDMNLEDKKELDDVTPAGYLSLNTNAIANTNTNIAGPKPYDHVMVSVLDTAEVETQDNFEVINLINELAGDWSSKHADSAYPGNPYNHNMFRFYYTDHHPVLFKLKSLERDDD